MLRCFTVDRSGTLEEGQIISLVKYRDVEPPEVQIHVDSLFPDGVTSHGERYILSNNAPAAGVNEIIELPLLSMFVEVISLLVLHVFNPFLHLKTLSKQRASERNREHQIV